MLGLRTAPACMALAALLAACSGGGSGDSSTRPVTPELAAATIGPAGGTVAAPDGPHVGVSIVVPPGAVTAPTRFSISLAASGNVPGLFPTYRFEPSTIDFVLTQVLVTVRIGDVLFDPNASPSSLFLFRKTDLAVAWDALIDSHLDMATQTVSTSTRRLGEFVAWNGNLHRLFTQEQKVFDPLAPARTESLFGVDVTIGNGSLLMQVGRGSLASFWNSPASDNVLVLHGVLGSPLDFLGIDDLVASLGPATRNIVLVSYPSARGVARAANHLYDAIVANREPGFGCSIVGHSMGGLIGRYLLERSAEDQARGGWQPTDAPLGRTVDRLVMLGVPNAGAEFATAFLAGLLPFLPEEERTLAQTANDLSEQPGALTAQLNASYVDNATDYHIFYGDLGGGSDGVVSVQSALALPLFAPESATMFVAGHNDLHVRARQLGIASLIDSLRQTP